MDDNITIWKSVFEPNSNLNDYFEVKIPAKSGAKPIYVGMKDDQVCVWFEVNPNNKDDYFSLYVIGTGWGKKKKETKFLGTVQDNDGYMWHIYC